MSARLHDPDTYVTGVPFDELAALRDDPGGGGVVWVDEPELPGWPAGPGYHLVLRHADVRAVLGDAATYSSWLGGTQIRDPRTDEDLRFVRQMMLNQDPPDHARLRRLLHASFTPRAVRALEERIAEHARGIVDRMLAGPAEVDFAKEVSADLPLLALADILGLPEQDRWLMFDWANRVIGWQDPDYAVSAAFDTSAGSDLAHDALALRPTPDAEGWMPDPRSREGMPDLYRYAHLLGEAKRADAGDDVMSLLMSQRSDADGVVSIEEFENLFWLFAVAGNETLRNGLPGGLLGLLSDDAVQRELRASLVAHQEPASVLSNSPSQRLDGSASSPLLRGAVDEMLRWWTPVMTFRRTATRAVELGGVRLRRGDKVVVSMTAANRDPAVFEDPDRFDLRRDNARSHLAFGFGPHVCLGAHLARAQMTALFTQLLTRTRWIELAGEPAYLRSNFQRGVKRLPIRWS